MFLQHDENYSGSIAPGQLFSAIETSLGVIIPEMYRKAFCADISDESGLVTKRAMLGVMHQRQRLRGRALARNAEEHNTFQNDQLRKLAVYSAELWAKVLEVARSDAMGWRKGITSLFKSLDTDESGSVDILEFAKGLRLLGIKMSPAQVVVFRDDIDADGDGSISLDEFTSAVRIRLKAASASNTPNDMAVRAAWGKILGALPVDWRPKVEEVFLEFDADQSGEIDMEELAAGLQVSERRRAERNNSFWDDGPKIEAEGVALQPRRVHLSELGEASSTSSPHVSL